MANRNPGRRRSRKRRPAAAAAVKRAAAAPAEQAQAQRRAPGGAAGERPRAPWHPWPLAEILILVGAIGAVVGLRRGFSHGGPLLLAGIAAVLIGTVEVTLREHRSGYRSHALILAVMPLIVLDSAVILVVAAFTRPPRGLNLLLLALDGVVFWFLFKGLRARFLNARARAGGARPARPPGPGSRR